MRVLKFGGSSVKNAENISKVINILSSEYEGKGDYLVVVSALGGITDLLIEMSELASRGKDYVKQFEKFKARHIETAQELLSSNQYEEVKSKLTEHFEVLENLLKGIFLVREASPRTMDYVLSFGERSSAYIVSEACKARGLDSEYLDARNIIKTNKNFGFAKVDTNKSYENIRALFSNTQSLQIVTGFIATDKGGLTTTLGRGGSDYTAALLAGALEADALDIWTDVDGVLTSDPRKVKKAFTINQLSYNEAMEMSHFGAKVIYPPTILPALEKNIPIYIRNTFNESFKGTLISKDPSDLGAYEITGVSALQNMALLRFQGGGMIGVPGIAARLFMALAQQKINIVLITQGSSEYSISFAIRSDQVQAAVDTIKEEFEREFERGLLQEVKVELDKTIVAIVSERMRNQPGVAGKLFTALGNEGINVIAIAQGSSELNISFVIDERMTEKALNLIHDAFFLSSAVTMNIFSIGAGLIGGTLFQQIQDASQKLLEEQGIELRLIGLTNSSKMHFDTQGIHFGESKNILTSEGEAADLKSFVDRVISLDLPNSILIDNTASKIIPDSYLRLLENNVSIITPNKVASSSSYENYKLIKKTAKEKGVQFLYETNVGAGLPIISTIQNMVKSGDEIHKLEAVLSGSISYIFNTFGDGRSFSEIVKEAQKLGYTEPDPRDDLSGLDVIRKITILARETGLAIETSDVESSPILNDECLSANTVDEFFVALESMDKHFEDQLATANSKNQKLRFIASMENGKCSVGMEAVNEASPFYALEKTDNMLAIYSNRYKARPLIIKGPGAGADVTAAGVFAEILHIASSLMSRL